MSAQLLLSLSALLVLTTAQPPCDPQTQYEKDGQCCRMCEPGTRMTENRCRDPVCVPCSAEEYQDKYTTESKCKPQQKCDDHKNKQHASSDTKTKAECVCKDGFHCSSTACITCLPHQLCGPGQEVKSKGTDTLDTECGPCPEGTFSNSTSDTTCKTWTRCGMGFSVKQEGTTVSDRTCEESTRVHVVVILIPVFAVVILLFLGIWWYREKWRPKKANDQECIDCLAYDKVPGSPVLIQTPVEADDDDPQFSGIHGFSENGNIVAAENGKAEVFPRQESQSAG